MAHDAPKLPFKEALAAAQAGDPDAINELFTSFYPRVHELVHNSLARDLRDAGSWLTARFSTGDVVQEVFRSVLGDLTGFGGDSERAFVGYLSMVVRNRIIDAVRYHGAEMRDGRRAVPELNEELHPSSQATPLDHVLTAEDASRYQAALKEFPERERLLLRARFEGTATFEELSSQLGYSHEAAARRAFYGAVSKLTVALKPKGDGGEG